METPYKADKKEGIEKEYFMDGSLKRETPYVNDKREGWEKEYFYATDAVFRKTLYKEGASCTIEHGREHTTFDRARRKQELFLLLYRVDH